MAVLPPITDDMIAAWQDLDDAAQDMQTAMPSQITERAAALDAARKRLGAAFQKAMMSPARA